MTYYALPHVTAPPPLWGLGQVAPDTVRTAQELANDVLEPLGYAPIAEDGVLSAEACGAFWTIQQKALTAMEELEPVEAQASAFGGFMVDHPELITGCNDDVETPWPEPPELVLLPPEEEEEAPPLPAEPPPAPPTPPPAARAAVVSDTAVLVSASIIGIAIIIAFRK